MSGTKRTGVPPVAKARVETPLIPEKTVPEPKPVSDILEDEARTKNTGFDETRNSTERNPRMNPIKTVIDVVKNNKSTLAQKALVVGGAALGMLITSSLVDRLGNNASDEDVIVVLTDLEETPTEDTEPSVQ